MKRPAGRFFCGFLVSPALAVAASQPLKAQSEATRATPKLVRRLPLKVPTGGRDEIGRLALGEDEDHTADPGQAGELDHGQDVLEVRPPARPGIVHPDEEGDEDEADELLGEGREREEMGEILRCEGHGQSGDRPGIDDQEERPAEEEGDHGPVRFAEVDVSSAGFGHRSAELPEGQRPEEAQDRADDPDGQDEEGNLDGHGHVLGHEENARADDAADDDADDVPESEDPREALGRGCAVLAHAAQISSFLRI